MMLLVNTVLTLPHVRYAVARAYVDYIFVIIFSAKIYESYILSISLTYNLRVRTCAERSAREGFSIESRCKISIKIFSECKKCELLRVSNLKFAHVNIYLRLFMKISFSATQKIV